MAKSEAESEASEAKPMRPSIVDEMYPQEVVIHNQKEKQEPRLMYQAEQLPIAWAEEKHLVGQVLVNDDFVVKGTNSGLWKYAGFFPGGYENRITPAIHGDWQPVNTPPTPFGIQLSNFALQLGVPISLKSVSLYAKITIRIKGESTFWIINRGESITDPEAVICKIRKEPECQRVFLVFGSLAGPAGAFRFFKNQELPEMEKPSADAIACDFLNLRVNFLDNGDDRVFVDLSSKGYEAKGSSHGHLSMSCSYFIPCMRATRLVFAGNGDSVEVRKVSVEYKERLKSRSKPGSDRKDCCVLA